MEERHEKAFIRKKAFVECVKKVKNNLCYCFNLSFSVFNILVTPRMRRLSLYIILSQLTTPCSPFAPSPIDNNELNWLIRWTTSSLCKQLFHSGRLPLIVLLII